jgi:hypothetical protein
LDRKFFYPSQVPMSADWLQIQRNTMIALSYDIKAWGGTNTLVDGLTVGPTSPATMAVQVAPGSIVALNAVDQSAYGALPVDVTHQIMQQGILLDAVNLTLTPPGTSGQAINYLIQVQFQQSDTDPTVLSYFNSANPTVPFLGPAGSGTSQPTSRKGIVVAQAKAGVAATAGTQTTPSPDAGWTGLYSVTVANGAVSITSANIAQLVTAPFLSVKLPQVPAYVQQGAFAYGADTGTANAMVVALNPQPAAGVYPVSLFVKKIASANTGAMNITITGVGTIAIINADSTALTGGQMASGFMAHLVFDGTSYRFMNGTATTSVGSLTASSGEGISVTGGGITAMNVPGLTANGVVGTGDLFPYYNQTDAHHRTATYTQLSALILAQRQTLSNVQVFTANGTYFPTAGTKSILVFATGGGGAGGSSNGGNSLTGGGGEGGCTVMGMFSTTGMTSVAVTIGAGGVPSSANAAPYSFAGNGGTTTFGSLTAPGGYGGVNSSNWATAQGGNSQVGAAGLVVMPGNPAEPPGYGADYRGGNGGSALWYGGAGLGSNANTNTTTVAAAGGNATGYGGGGGGADSGAVAAVQGGTGKAGVIIVFEF